MSFASFVIAEFSGNPTNAYFEGITPLVVALVGAGVLVLGFSAFRNRKISQTGFKLAILLALGLWLYSLMVLAQKALKTGSAEIPPFLFSVFLFLVICGLLALVLRFGTAAKRTQYQLDRLICGLAAETFERGYPELMPLPTICVIIPAYNEAENVGRVLDQMPDEVHGQKLVALVIDDGSKDKTTSVVKAAGYPVIKSPVRRGGGAALRAGFEIAERGGAEIVVTMDADGQHLPEEIQGLVAPVLEGRYAVVIGSRVLGKREKDSLARWIGIHFFNGLIRFLTGVRITDCSNGFRAIRVDALKRLELRQDQYHTTELIIEAAKKGISLGEAPVTVLKRHSGKSKKGGNWTYAFHFTATILKTWWR